MCFRRVAANISTTQVQKKWQVSSVFYCVERTGRTNFTNRKHATVYTGSTLDEKATSLVEDFRFSLPYLVVIENVIRQFEKSELKNSSAYFS